jgi:hypothetical protein
MQSMEKLSETLIKLEGEKVEVRLYDAEGYYTDIIRKLDRYDACYYCTKVGIGDLLFDDVIPEETCSVLKFINLK